MFGIFIPPSPLNDDCKLPSKGQTSYCFQFRKRTAFDLLMQLGELPADSDSPTTQDGESDLKGFRDSMRGLKKHDRECTLGKWSENFGDVTGLSGQEPQEDKPLPIESARG